jgi:hypothetical protein
MCAKKMGKESQRATSPRTNGHDLQRSLSWVVNNEIFVDLVFHGNVTWTATALVRLAIFWVWSPETSLVKAADEAIINVTSIFGSAAVNSYQALVGALRTYTQVLLPVLWCRVQHLMKECDEHSWRVGLWLALAVDGSRVGMPRTLKNEQRNCKPRNTSSKKKRKKYRHRHANATKRAERIRKKSHYDPQPVAPQMWLTLIWHIGQRLPWCWEIGPSYSSEREHVLQMLSKHKFPENTLFCGDAGFVGYSFWRAIHDQGHHFLMRVGGNTRLLKKLAYTRERDGIVYSWPEEARKKKQLPLVLRLLKFHTGRGYVYLVTNVLQEKKLTATQAAEIYRRRWGVELQFRAFKQTYQRTKLRCRIPENADVELHWSLMGLCVVQLLAFKEQVKMEEPHAGTSIAMALRVVRSLIRNEAKVPPRGKSLNQQLFAAVTDNYQRYSQKQSRNYPRRKEEPFAGPPKIESATDEQKRQLQNILELKLAT